MKRGRRWRQSWAVAEPSARFISDTYFYESLAQLHFTD